jgi:hypothetical protein
VPGTPVPWTSPVTWSFPDTAGKAVSATFNFNNATLALTAVTAVTQPGCAYKNIYFGLGPDGTPDTTLATFGNIVSSVPKVITAAALAGFGFATLTDVLAGQITAGP